MSGPFSYSAVKRPPIPVAELTLMSPDGSQSIAGLSGHLDTAADWTVIPLHLIQQLGLQPVKQVRAQGFGLPAFTLDVYQVRVVVTGVFDLLVNALGHSGEPYVLVGRDILNLFRVTFDGPNQVVEFH